MLDINKLLVYYIRVDKTKGDGKMRNLNENQTKDPTVIECLFKGETYWGQDGNLYSCCDDYDYTPLAYVTKELIEGLDGSTDYIYTYSVNVEEMLL